LVDFAVHAGPLKELGVRVAAASVDPIDNVRSLKEGLRVGFPMYAEVDAAAVSAATGAHMHSGDKTYLHATGFLVNPEGTVINAVYSTGPIGRFTAPEILRNVRFETDKAV
jgi:alkyl hydroperoxide reductase subunit AhpC